jgi:hypothetical protein
LTARPIDVLWCRRGRSPPGRRSGRRVDKQAEQTARQPAAGPYVAVEHAVIVGKLRPLLETHDAQGRRDGASARDKDRAHHQDQRSRVRCESATTSRLIQSRKIQLRRPNSSAGNGQSELSLRWTPSVGWESGRVNRDSCPFHNPQLIRGYWNYT